MSKAIEPGDLLIHFLNTGFGDNIILQFPEDAGGKRRCALVDCKDSRKTMDYLDKLQPDAGSDSRLAFICATHPHFDHIAGINGVMQSRYCPKEFWDSGFRHFSQTYKQILLTVIDKKINMIRVSSGLEWYFDRVKISVLSPSVALRNRYATYGVDMNNASIVLRIENCDEDMLLTKSVEYSAKPGNEAGSEAGPAVAILAGDAEFDSWAHICQEFPKIERTSEHDPMVKKMVNYLAASVIKVAHHGSMHSTPLDVYEKMGASLAVISTMQEPSTRKLKNTAFRQISRSLFPHQAAVSALEESDVRVLTTDGSYEGSSLPDGSHKDSGNDHPGSIVALLPPGGRIRWVKLKDKADEMAVPPDSI